jgi:hypothetical protein
MAHKQQDKHERRRKGMLSCYLKVVSNKKACNSQRKCTLSCYLLTYDLQVTRWQSFTSVIGTHLVTILVPACASSETAQVGFQRQIYRNPSDPHWFELQKLSMSWCKPKTLQEPMLSDQIEPRTEIEPYRCQPCES